MNRRIGLSLSAISLSCVLALVFAGCEPNEASFSQANHGVDAPASPVAGPKGTTAPGRLVASQSSAIRNPLLNKLPARTQQTILVASFNIQAFGDKKVSNPKIAERLAAILQKFDIVAVQEIRAKNQTVVPQLLRYVNAQGAKYDYVIGPQLGRTNSKEQYAFIYDSTRIATNPNAAYTVDDSADLLHREPMVARFVTRVPQNVVPFSFTIIDIHTDPDEVKQELPVLNTVFKTVREFEWAEIHEDDVMLMGDLNASPAKFGPLAKVPGIYWAIQDQATNTRRTELYDNILFDRELTNEFTGRAGVLDLSDFFGIGVAEALEISDHNPIWAEFSIMEQPSGGGYSIANQPTDPARR